MPPAGYLSANGIEACVQWLANTYPQICQLITLPEASIEGRTIHCLKIANGAAPGRRGVLLLGGAHARELVPPDCLVSFALKLCSAYSTGSDLSFGVKVYPNLDVRLVVDVLDTLIFPLVNPDGRAYVQMVGGDPWWRKNRNPNPALPCMGVDINRDYDFLWSSGIGTSSDSCSEVFKGAGAFSEPETRNVRSLLDSYSHIVSMMDIHSYSQLVLHPWGDDDNQSTDPSQNFLNPAYNGMRGIPGDTVYREYIPSDDLDWFASTGNKVRDAIAAVRGTTYTVEQAMRLYPTSATGHDYAYSRHFSDPTKRRIYGYTLETGLEFQPVYAEALNIISEVSSGVFQLCLSSLCVVESMLAGTTLAGDLEDMRALRREMEPSEVGRSYARLLDRHSDELLHLMAGDESLRARALRLLEDTYEVVKSRHQAQPLVFGPSLVRALEELLDDLAVAGSTELAAMAARLRPNLALFEGKTLTAGLTAARPVGARKPVLAPAPVRKSELAKEKPMPEQHERLIRIAVFAYTNKPLEGAHVTLSSSDPADRRAYTLSFDANLGVYVASGIPPARYLLRAEAQGLAPEQREVQVDPSGLEATVILGTPGLPFLYRGEVRVPFEPHADLVAVALDAKSAAGAAERVLRLARERGLDPVEVGEQVRRQNVHLFRFRQKPADPEVERLHEELRKVPGAVAVGSVVRLDKDSLSFLTNELVVKFKSHVVLEEVPSIAKQFQMATLRRLPQAGNAFLFRLPGATYARLEVAVRLVESGLVDYAEPNLISTVVDDVLNPTDFLFPMQWHLTLIHCPEAWRVINDNIAPELAFGSPNISIAVVDSGVDVGNPDFVGNVSNGNPKVYQVFDFQNMVANNNARSSGHGTCCAGIATALANNPAGVGGQNEGVAGSAGNCRLMAIERPFPGNEVAYSDMYVWTAGFDPGSSTAGFPAAISPGADVITNSFGYSIGMPISGLMTDTFNLLTTYGRGGRGVLLFFSAGNAAVDFTLQRPWAAYTRTFAVAASTLNVDGVTEIRAPYSNFGGAGIIDIGAPSDSQLGAAYNPPVSYGTVTATDRTSGDFPPDAPSHWTVQTTTSGPAAAGATGLVVANSAGFAVNQFIVVDAPGAPGTEFSMVTAIPDATHLSVTPLKNGHAAGTAVFGGPANSLSNFGGTSSATPLSAGLGALLLTVRPSLTWVQVRDILRGTAVHIDAANTDPVGIWRDANGVASNQPGYTGPVYSRWYGFGRIDALAAVNGVLTLGATADLIIRDNLGDSGLVPSVGRFWDSPDIWVRNLSPAAEGAAALPANYATPGPTQDVAASHDNYIYARVKNIGPVATSDFYLRIYLTHFAGTEFVYPADFIPTNHPGQPLPSPLVPGTYLIGEVKQTALAPNGSDIVNVVWPVAAIPPQTAMVSGTTVHWHPCLLVEISPQDGPAPSGPHVWDHNDLGQKNVTINYAADDGTFAVALVAGNLLNRSESLVLLVDRAGVPAGIQLYVDMLDPKARKELKEILREEAAATHIPPSEVVLLEDTRVLIEQGGQQMRGSEIVVTLPRNAHLKLCESPEWHPRPSGVTIGYHQGREVFWLPSDETVRLPLVVGRGRLVPLILGGVIRAKVPAGAYLVGITQQDKDGRTSGAAAVDLRIRQPEGGRI